MRQHLSTRPRRSIQRLVPSRAALGSIALGAALACGAAFAPQAAVAAPPQVKQQVPGFYRHAVGGFEVTALYDGYIDLDAKLLHGLRPSEVQRLLARRFIADTHGVQTAVNAFLVHTGGHLVLVDTGAAACFGPTLGRIVENLKAAGYQPADVDTVLLTHLHPDHVCGARAADGSAVFPNATLWVSQAESDFWLDPARAGAAPEAMRPMFTMARDAVAPYEASGRLKRFAPGEAVLDGPLQIVPTAGHTPGHTSFLFRAGARELLVWGDIVHSHAVQFAHPSVSLEFDVDEPRAIAARRALFAKAAAGGWWVAGAHLPFPGIGHVRRDGKAYAWEPVEFGPIRDDRPDR